MLEVNVLVYVVYRYEFNVVGSLYFGCYGVFVS